MLVGVSVLVGERVYVGVAGDEVAAGLQPAMITKAKPNIKRWKFFSTIRFTSLPSRKSDRFPNHNSLSNSGCLTFLIIGYGQTLMNTDKSIYSQNYPKTAPAYSHLLM